MVKITSNAVAEGRRLRASFERKNLALSTISEERLYRAAKRVEADAVLMAPVDTGRLKNSLGTRKVGHLDFEVGSNVHYAKLVELGTINQSPQPYLNPALAKNRKHIIDALSGSVKGAFLVR